MIGKTNAASNVKLQSGKSVNAGLSPQVIYADSGYDGLKDLTINAIGLDNLTIALDFSKGNQTVSTRDGYYANTIIVTKPENFLASNIKKDEVIAGIKGTFEGNFKPEQSKTVEFNPGSANNITIAPDEGYVLSGVEVGKPVTMIPENIKSGIDIGGVVGTFEGGVNTSDATATSNDILLGKTAYANNEKITGTIPTYNNEHENGYVQTNTLKKLLDATKSCYYLFMGYKGTSPDDIINYNDTENVTEMGYMFYNCGNLISIPNLNTNNVKGASFMFYGCYNLTSIPNLNTSNLTSASYMFGGCSRLVTIPLLNTSKVTNMSYMLDGCKNLETIPLLNTSNVTNISSMFEYCEKLTSVPQLDVSKVTNMQNTFKNCFSLTAIHMTGMKVSFDISASTLFTTEALHEIIDNLATVTSSQTLTMGSTNLAKVSSEYRSKATNKGWTLA